MTATPALAPPAGPSTPDRVRWAFADAWAMTQRNLLRYVRLPQLLLFSTVQPVMFVLLFVFVFGGAITVPGDYRSFLIPGIIVQAVVFGSAQTGVGLADDLSRGMVERFRSLPMARSAVLAGRALGDLVRNVFVVMLMVGVGYLIGFRFQAGAPRAVAAILLVAFFGFALSWISATIGLIVKDPESAQAGGFVWLFPMVFASSIFVPVETMPTWLQAFARLNPITVTADASRALSLGGPAASSAAQSLAWSVCLIVLFGALAVRRYRRS